MHMRPITCQFISWSDHMQMRVLPLHQPWQSSQDECRDLLTAKHLYRMQQLSTLQLASACTSIMMSCSLPYTVHGSSP